MIPCRAPRRRGGEPGADGAEPVRVPAEHDAEREQDGRGGEIGVTLRFEGGTAFSRMGADDDRERDGRQQQGQIAALIAAFNAVNAFLSTDTSGMTATLPDDVEWIGRTRRSGTRSSGSSPRGQQQQCAVLGVYESGASASRSRRRRRRRRSTITSTRGRGSSQTRTGTWWTRGWCGRTG